jgi:ADP-heptose:LPS heptosyltransferase
MIKPQNLLIVRTDRIGDVVLSLPLAGIIKSEFPNCKITFLVREYTKDLVLNHPQIDDVILLEEKYGETLLSENLEKIKKNNFDTCIAVHPKFKIAFILYLAKIKNRIGTGYRWYSFLFNKKYFEHRKYGTKHELEHNVNLLQNIGIDKKISPDDVKFEIVIDEESDQKIEQYFAQNGINTDLPTIIVHPGSGGSAVDYPISRLKALLSIMAHELSINVILTGTESEKKLCDMLTINENIKNAAGKFNLHELTALINKSDAMIANSTGPIHIAAALDKYVIGFYPKIPACNVTRWGPYTKKKRVFEPTIECENCTRKQCEDLNCMNSIDERNVFESVKEVVQKIVKKSIH